MDTDELRRRAEQWMANDTDPASRAEIAALLAEADLTKTDLADRFAGDLAFGTAGLRGVLGAGPNRMNAAVVIRATRGLAREMVERVPDAFGRGAIVGGDARRQSFELSSVAAQVLAASGVPVSWYRRPVPTPLVGFAVKKLHAAAGVVITASHNPPQYNGYKVYWENAAQIVPPIDAQIAARIRQAPPAKDVFRPSLPELVNTGLLKEVPASVEAAYLEGIRDLAVHKTGGDRSLGIVYTPLHGCGNQLVRAALAQAGFTNLTTVPEQAAPDGAFPTVAFPNPEEKGTMDLAFALAKKTGARLVLANDPDVDRLAVGIPSAGGYRQLTGNEVGVLLGHYLLVERPSGRPRAVLSSIVSSPLLGKIAESLGVHYEETLTGFKWLASRSFELRRGGLDVVLAYEEALGYCVGDLVYDKDGISAAALVAEIAAVLAGRGRTIDDELDAVARKYGCYVSAQHNVVAMGPGALGALQKTMQKVRGLPRATLDGDEMLYVTDYDGHYRTDLRTGRSTGLTLPRSDVLAFEFASGARIVARPSGTEPKAKFYFDVPEDVAACETVGQARARATARLERLKAAFLEGI